MNLSFNYFEIVFYIFFNKLFVCSDKMFFFVIHNCMFDETEWLENRKEEKTFVHFFCIQQGQNDLKQKNHFNVSNKR